MKRSMVPCTLATVMNVCPGRRNVTWIVLIFCRLFSITGSELIRILLAFQLSTVVGR